FNSAVRQSHVPGANMASAAAKADAVREEYEEAQNKVEMVKDNLSIELCNFIAKESEHSSRLVALLEAQAAYHKKALQAIEEMVPKMKGVIAASPIKPVFGTPLEEHLRVLGRDISLVLEACIITLLEFGMEEEGLFRIAGGALKVKKLRACLDAHVIDMEEFSTDPHTVAGVLKQYLRELPEPLLTFELYSEFMQTTTLPHEQRMQALLAAVNKLPPANYNNVRYLIKFLAQLAQKSSKNKMTPSNIGIVMGPNLLWSRGETTPNMLTAGAVSAIIEAFVIHADRFFPGEFDFHLTGRGCAPPSPCVAPSSAIASLASLTGSQAEVLIPRSGGSQPDLTETPPEERSSSPQQDVSTEPQDERTDSGDILIALDSSSATFRAGADAGEEASFDSGQGDMNTTTRSGDGLMHTVAPPTNLSLAGSARQRPTMPASSSLPSVRGPAGSQDNLLSMGTTRPEPTTPTTPSKSVHSDMYSTVFALHSLGEGNAASQYLTRVRALWDGQFQSSPLPPSLSERQQAPVSQGPPSEAAPRAAADRGWSSAGSRAEEPGRGSGPGSRGNQDIDFYATMGSESPSQNPADHTLTTAATPPRVSHSPVPDSTTSPTIQASQASPVAQSTIPAANSLSPTSGDSPEGPPSPKVHRRQTKKPAPPPPPDRPYSVAVTAMAKSTDMARSTDGAISSQTWPRGAPLVSPDSPQADMGAEGDKQRYSPPERRISGHGERPHGPPPERPSAPPPERPKLPPYPQQQSGNQQPSGAPPSGHQRSASTGAMYINTGPNAATTSTTTGSSHESLQTGIGSSLTTAGQGSGMPVGTSTLGRHSSMRPSRPNPPPPPPPINQKNEQTYL
ncbi:hypothetical protein BaRGS_00006750, partial [Batillaria attramentaria]